MPYYKWVGIGLDGRCRKGNACARNERDLQEHLHQKELGLVRSRIDIPYSFFSSFNRSMRADLYKQLAVLLEAGVFLHEALSLLAIQTKHAVVSKILHDIALDICHGNSLSQGLSNYPVYFDQMAVQLVAVGQESGSLSQSLRYLAAYEEMVARFGQRIRSALWTPVITLLFFLVIAAIIFTVIVPNFVMLFDSVDGSLPWITQFIIGVSELVSSWYFYQVIIGSGLAMSALMIWLYRSGYVGYIDWLSFYMPGIGYFYTSWHSAHYFASLYLLLSGGLPLVDALAYAAHGVSNRYMRRKLLTIEADVRGGMSLHEAARNSDLFNEQVQALLYVGESSHCLPLMFQKASDAYLERLNQLLIFISTLVQPALMILLGLLITALVFAIYLPIFNLSQVIA